LIGTENGADLFLRDEALGFGAPLLRVALGVGVDETDLGATKAGQAQALRERKVEVLIIVDDIDRGLERALRIDTHLGTGARQGIGRADHHFRSLRTRSQRHQRGSGSGSEQNVAASDRHRQSPLLFEFCAYRMKRLTDSVKPEEAANAAH